MSIGNLFWRWPWLPVLALALALVFSLLVRMAHRRKPNQQTGARIWTLKSDLDTEEGHEALRRWRGSNRLAAILLCLAPDGSEPCCKARPGRSDIGERP